VVSSARQAEGAEAPLRPADRLGHDGSQGRGQAPERASGKARGGGGAGIGERARTEHGSGEGDGEEAGHEVVVRNMLSSPVFAHAAQNVSHPALRAAGLPAAARNVNWLPAPAAPFRMSLRIYQPTPAVLGGSWKPPPIEPVG
jgi:hypothetical protein